MKPPAFAYLAVAALDEVVWRWLGASGDEKILAAKRSLVPMLNFRLVCPSILIDINRVPGLGYVDPSGNVVTIDALNAPPGEGNEIGT